MGYPLRPPVHPSESGAKGLLIDGRPELVYKMLHWLACYMMEDEETPHLPTHQSGLRFRDLINVILKRQNKVPGGLVQSEVSFFLELPIVFFCPCRHRQWRVRDGLLFVNDSST